MNIHHLELFYYTAKAGGITPSLRLIPYGIQQPAVSSQLGRLEESLGTRLFHRRPFSLTPAGREIYQAIAPFFGGIGELARRVQLEANQHIRLAASASVLREHLPDLLKTMQRLIPDLRVTLREADQAAAERLLQEHEIDLAVTLLETKPIPGIRFERLLKVRMVVLVPAGSEWKSAAALLKAARKDTPPLIASSASDQISRLFQDELAERGISWASRIEPGSLDLVEAYVERGFGVGLSLAQPGRVLPRSLRALSLPGFPQLNFGALSSGHLTAPAARFLELARARAAELSKG